MKSHKIHKFENKPGYPYLGDYKGKFIVLFTSEETGTLVHKDKDFHNYKLGEYSTEWSEKDFITCRDTIQLFND